MKAIIVCLFSCFILTQGVFSQTDSLARWEYPSLEKDMHDMGEAFRDKNYPGFLRYIHPGLIKAVGGPAKMTAILEKAESDMKSQNMTIKSMTFQPPIQTEKKGKSVQVIVPHQTEFSNGRGRVTTYTHYLGFSEDEGKTWKFIDANNKTIQQIKMIVPNINTNLVIPQKKQPVVERN